MVASALAAGLVGCSGGGDAPAQTNGGSPQRVLSVAARSAEVRDLARSVTVTGAVEPLRTIGVTSQASGSLLSVRVEEGDRVSTGQVLAELDARETRAQLERAQAVLVNARAAYERAEALRVSEIITAAEFEQARAQFTVAQSDVELWRTRLGFTRISAPAPGIVTAKLVEAGSAVSPNQRLFDLADDSILVVRVQVSELDVVHLTPGTDVTVLLDAYPNLRLTGAVRRIFPSADPQSRLVPVEVALEDRPGGVDVRPGFLARVTFPLDQRVGALVVPQGAIGVTDGAPFVFLVEADTLVMRRVGLGLSVEGWVEVTQGLINGERVVMSGHTNLRPGMLVRAVDGRSP